MPRPLRVGIVGCGNVALNFHLPAYQARPDRFEVVALADPTPARLELGRTGAALSPEHAHLDANALLARDDVDLVDVCTPQHLRRDLLIAAAEAGKHIVCEKPMASVPADAAAADSDVEGLALWRMEADGRAALVNVGWGLGHGGSQVIGTKGRLTIHYREDGTFPWAPFERLTVTTDAGTLTEPLPGGKELRPLVLGSLESTLLDIADAIEERRPPTADGRQGLHILETTLAAYASAALGRTVALPFASDDPVFRSGVMGLRELDTPDWTPVRRRGLLGLGV